MANTKTKSKNPLIGAQAQPVPLENTINIDKDVKKQFIDTVIDAGLSGKLDSSDLDRFTSLSNVRTNYYAMIDTMASDSDVGSVVRTIVSDVCSPGDNGHIVWAEAEDPKASKFINYILNVANVDKNITLWTYCLVTYGDVYLKLLRKSDFDDMLFNKETVQKVNSHRLYEAYDEDDNFFMDDVDKTKNEIEKDKQALYENVNVNLHDHSDHYTFALEMVKDPSTFYELNKYGSTYGFVETPNREALQNLGYTGVVGADGNFANSYQMKSGEVNIYQADDFVHAYLTEGINRYPEVVNILTDVDEKGEKIKSFTYDVCRGQSMLAPVYKTWREKKLIENALLLTRFSRSTVIRKFEVDTSTLDKTAAKQALRNVKQLFEQQMSLDKDVSMGEYTNPGALINNVYLNVNNGHGAVTVDTIGGDDLNLKDIADLDNWVTKFYGSFGIPKQFFGHTEDGAGFNGGESLTILSEVYANNVKRIQNALLQMLYDFIGLILIDKGNISYLHNFTLKMESPMTQKEKSNRDGLVNKISALSSIQGLLADVETKSRRLEVAKELVSTLDFGEKISYILADEIDVIKKREEDELKAAEAAAAAALTETEGTTEVPSAEAAEAGSELPAPKDLENALDLVTESLDNISSKTEPESTESVLEDTTVNQETNLPSPEEFGEDFTNKYQNI